MSCVSKEQATRLGRELVARLRGKGSWRVHVWQNLEWHYCADALGGRLHVSPADDGRFFCMLSEAYPHAGSYLWHTTKTFQNPNDAVRYTLALARRAVDKLDATVSEAEQVPVTTVIRRRR